jgi:RNA polymerase-binding protein DksA
MSTLSQAQLEQLKEQLNADHQKLVEEIRGELENSGNQQRIELLNREPGDSGDESLATSLADFNLTMMDRQIEELRDVELAFQRLKEGEYGVCVDCGQEISFPRLNAYPTAKRCIQCQEKREKMYAHGGQPRM